MTFAQADVTSFGGYDGRFSTILDSGLFHALPVERRQDYLQAISRAATPSATLYILAFAAGALDQPGGDRPGPRGFTKTEFYDAVSTLWQVDDLRDAKVYGNADALDSELPNAEQDNEGHFIVPGLLLSAHKPD